MPIMLTFIVLAVSSNLVNFESIYPIPSIFHNPLNSICGTGGLQPTKIKVGTKAPPPKKPKKNPKKQRMDKIQILYKIG